MFGWFKRKQAAPSAAMPNGPAGSAAIPQGPLAQAPVPMTIAAAISEPAPAMPVPAAQPSNFFGPPASITGAAIRALVAQAPKITVPELGMPAIGLTPTKGIGMTVVGIQGNGRRVLAKATGSQHVYAFTRRTDDSYRLEGAGLRGGGQLLLGATLATAKNSVG